MDLFLLPVRRIAFSSLVVVTAASTFAADPLVGTQIIAIRPGIILHKAPSKDSLAVDYSLALPVWKVQEIKADWLRIGDGWLPAAEAVRIDQAIKYFTDLIERSPTAYAYAARSRAWLVGAGDIGRATADAEIAMRLDASSCDALHAKASLASRSGRYADAIECYSRIIALSPQCKEIYGWYALARIKEKDIGDAIDVLSEGLRRWPGDALLTRVRARLYRQRGLSFAKSGDLVKAEQDYDHSICDWTVAQDRSPSPELKKECASTYAARAQVRLAARHVDEAISDFNQSLALAPDVRQILYLRGLAYGFNNSHRLAIEDCKKAIQLGLKDAKVYAGYSRSLIMLDKVDEALTALNESIRLDNRNPAAYELRGRAWFGKEAYPQALADFDKSIELDPTFTDAYENRAAVWQQLGKYEKAIEDCATAIKLNPRSSHALAKRAVSFANLGRFDEALADCNRALRIEPTNSTAYQTRGSILGRQGDYKAAIFDLTRALTFNPLDLTAYRSRAAAWSKLGEYSKAKEDLDAYVRIAPQDSLGYRARAAILKGLGDEQGAVEDLRTADRVDTEKRR